MGYGSYEIVGGELNGQWGGYNHLGRCNGEGCTAIVCRSVAEMCGRWPHGGGDGNGCGAFFCDDHLWWAGSDIGYLCVGGCGVECPECHGEGVFYEERSHSGGDVAEMVTGHCERCNRSGVLPVGEMEDA